MDTSQKTLIEEYASRAPFIEHEDFNKCGQCLKQMISHQVAKKYVLMGKISNDYIKEYLQECDSLFQESFLYKEIKSMLNSGIPLQEAIKKMEDKGFIP